MDVSWIIKRRKVAQSYATLIPWTVTNQVPLRQEHWSESHFLLQRIFPSPEDLPDLGIKPRSPALQADALTSEQQGKLKESWAQKTWCFWTVVLETTLESLLDCKIKPVNPKGNQSWIFIGGTDAEADSPILWPHDAKDPDPGKVEGKRGRWRQRTRWLDGITDSVDN